MAEVKTLHEKLVEIQQELKVPKDQWNDFSKFNYRSAEAIEEKAKPLCHARGLTLITSDEPVAVGNWNYIYASAILSDGNDKIVVTAAAREQETKKGMDASQISGSASSYARKYALSGLFALDDTKDADSHDNRQSVGVKPVSRPTATEPTKRPSKLTGMATDKQRETIKNSLTKIGIALEDQKGYLIETYGVEIPLTKEGASFVIDDLFEQTSYKRKESVEV